MVGAGEGEGGAQEESRGVETERPDDDGPPLAKRTVAMHVAYVGTAYKGSSVNRTLGEDATIEQVLELAILKAGFMKDANFGSFSKVKWTRASRTDKGVHSLGTVMGMRMLVHDERYTAGGDPEGLTHADLINKHLPPAIRVLTVQKVHKKFNARFLACSRSYQYYLPASLLELRMDGSDFDKERIARLRAALKTFLGPRAFHNYTKMKAHDGGRLQTKDYNKLREEAAEQARERGEDPRIHAEEVKAKLKQQEKEESQRKKQKLEDGGSAAGNDDCQQPADKQGEAGDGEVLPVVSVSQAAGREPDARDLGGSSRQRKQQKDDEDDGDDDEEGDEEGELDDQDDAKRKDPAHGPRDLTLLWTTDSAPHDKVTQTYYRKIFSFEADDPVPLVEGGTPCLRLSVHGQSFMLHHIRHMVGTAVAVALGVLPMELLEASLQPPARVTLPRAPPHTLLLNDCQFYPFPAATSGRGGGVDSGLASVTGERLGVRKGGEERKEEFRQSVLQPALQVLVDLPDWDLWLANLKQHAGFPAERLEPFLQEYSAWMSQAEARRQKRSEGMTGGAAGAGPADAEGGAAHAEGGAGRGRANGRGYGRGRGRQGGDRWWTKRKQGK